MNGPGFLTPSTSEPKPDWDDGISALEEALDLLYEGRARIQFGETIGGNWMVRVEGLLRDQGRIS